MAVIEFLKIFYTLFFVWLTCITGVSVFHKTLPYSYQGFTLLTIMLGVLETIGNIIGFVYGNNHFFFNILYAIEMTFVPWFFKFWIQRRWIQKTIQVFTVVFPLFVLVNTIWIQGFFTLQTFSFVPGGSFILLLCVAYLGELYTREETQDIFRNPIFWFSLAYLIYFAVSVPYFGMLNYLVTKYLSFATLYYELIYEPTICLYNIFLIIGLLWMKPRKK
ncbi:MAG TPA: hypothetical protein VFN95_12345 [Flavitalea sp.]|nr:hypothetical protein [Flavitalea sp.]